MRLPGNGKPFLVMSYELWVMGWCVGVGVVR